MAHEPWRPLFERSVAAWDDGSIEQGQEACERLLSLPDLPDQIEELTRQNQTWYARALTDLVPETRLLPLEFPVAPGWSRLNPSIAAAPDGFRAIVRSSNFWLDYGEFVVLNPGDPVRTTNYLLDLDADLAMTRCAPIHDATDFAGRYPCPVQDYEDCRLLPWGNEWRAIGAARDRHPTGISQSALLTIGDDTFTDVRLLSDPVNGVREKNWVPVLGDAERRFVYGAFPTVVLRYDEPSGTVVEVARHAAPRIARQFRGGSQLIPFDTGYLALVHETALFEDRRRVYRHRWAQFDEALRIVRVSPQFYFLYRRVEFAAGLAWRGDDLVASFGVNDREAWLAVIPAAAVRALLAPCQDEAWPETSVPGGIAAPADGQAERPAFPIATAAPEPGTERLPPPLPPDAIVATTLAGDSRELVGDALRSVVDWVDVCLLIDTGITDDTIDAARAVAGDKLVIRRFPWRDDFAAARNFALDAAAELGAAWAVTVDTDERLDLGDLDLRAWLRETAADAIYVRHANGTYAKQRIFRLPARGRWEGPTHEAFETGETSVTLPQARFTEMVKSEAAYRSKFERDLPILERQVAERPDDPRWRYYLGDALQNLERFDEAIEAYRACWRLRGWDEEAAWAMYRAAQCWLALDRPDDAIEACAAGMARHAGVAELPWMAGYAAYQAGRDAQAIYWANVAASLGYPQGCAADVPRLGFRRPFALYEGPFDILRFAYRRLGDDAGAENAERRYHDARRLREEAGLPD